MLNKINIIPCKNNIGAFIDIDINFADKIQIIEIQKTVNEFGVVFFRKQKLTSVGYIKFAKNFGNFFNYPMLKGLKNYPDITVVEKLPGETFAFGEGFHTDSTYVKNPPTYTMLYSVKTPVKGRGNTQFASQYLSYEKLPEKYKKEIENLKAVFSADGPISKTRNNRTAESGTGIDPKTLSAQHRIVRTNNKNNKKSIYLSPGHVTEVVGYDKEKSKELLTYLYRHQTRSEFIYNFEWEPNCLAIWANSCILHNPINDYNEHRVMHRITVQ
jgi:taurine dioxygenase